MHRARQAAALRLALFAVVAAVVGVTLARVPTTSPLADVLHAGEKVIAAQPPPTAPPTPETTTTATTPAPAPVAVPVAAAPRPVRVRPATAPAAAPAPKPKLALPARAACRSPPSATR